MKALLTFRTNAATVSIRIPSQMSVESCLDRKRSVNPEGKIVARGFARRHILTVRIELQQQPVKTIFRECRVGIQNTVAYFQPFSRAYNTKFGEKRQILQRVTHNM